MFSEQGTSASHIAAAKFLDAIARMLGNKGENSDAMSAYTQVVLDQVPEATRGLHSETWISLPPHRRPKSWSNVQDPVVKLLVNLYGHPLAGLFWERHFQRAGADLFYHTIF